MAVRFLDHDCYSYGPFVYRERRRRRLWCQTKSSSTSFFLLAANERRKPTVERSKNEKKKKSLIHSFISRKKPPLLLLEHTFILFFQGKIAPFLRPWEWNSISSRPLQTWWQIHENWWVEKSDLNLTYLKPHQSLKVVEVKILENKILAGFESVTKTPFD